MEVGADPVARDNDGLTTLHAATQGGHLDVVRVSCNFYVNMHAYVSCMHKYSSASNRKTVKFNSMLYGFVLCT